MKSTRKMIEQSILFAIAKLSNDIQTTEHDAETRFVDAQTIKELAEAYDLVHYGKIDVTHP